MVRSVNSLLADIQSKIDLLKHIDFEQIRVECHSVIMHIILIILLSMIQNPDKPKLIYVGDPMCSWCYGISEELYTIINKYEDELDVEIVMGGLRPYNTEKMSDMKDFLTHHWEDVNKASGQQFNYEILDSDLPYDTEPASRATVVVRDLDPSKEYAFFKGVQKTFYFENKNPLIPASFHDLLNTLGIDIDSFEEKFNSEEYKEKVKQDFRRANDLNARSFPTLLLEINGERYAIAIGYADASAMSAKIDKLIAK